MANPSRLQRQPFLTPIWLLALWAMAGTVVVLTLVWWLVTANSTAIIVVRHAEKVQVDGSDPPLTPAGEARAELLARMFGDADKPGHVDAIYVLPALRNRMTAAPLAARLGIVPMVVSADAPQGLARRALREHPGGRILVVGRSDTVPVIVAELSGADNIPPIAADEYGTMYIVTVPRIGHANLLRLNY
jgi:broad specificity phosphatase PhoE